MTLWTMSLSGAILVCLVLLLRTLSRDRLPKRTFPVLWEICLVRLLVPLPGLLRLPSLFQKGTVQETGTLRSEALYQAGDTVLSSTPGGLPAAGTVIQSGTAADAAASAASGLPVWQVLWLAGAVLLAVFFGVTYLRHILLFRDARPAESAYVTQWLADHPLARPVSVRISDRIDAPMTYGLFRPVILLPEGLHDTGQLSCVLLHEWMHIRHFDPTAKLLSVAALCLHWCNPAVWVLNHFLNRDLELACDEAVTARILNPAAYARTLLDLEERRSGSGRQVPFAAHFSEIPLKERIQAIMREKNRSLPVKLGSAALILGVVAMAAALAPARDADAATDAVVTEAVSASESVLSRDVVEGFSRTVSDESDEIEAASEAEIVFGDAATPVLDSEAVLLAITDSAERTGDRITFRIPEDLPNPEDLDIRITCRTEDADGSGKTYQLLGEYAGAWVPGQTCSIPWEDSYVEVTMKLRYTTPDGREESRRDTDLLLLVTQLAGLRVIRQIFDSTVLEDGTMLTFQIPEDLSNPEDLDITVSSVRIDGVTITQQWPDGTAWKAGEICHVVQPETDCAAVILQVQYTTPEGDTCRDSLELRSGSISGEALTETGAVSGALTGISFEEADRTMALYTGTSVQTETEVPLSEFAAGTLS